MQFLFVLIIILILIYFSLLLGLSTANFYKNKCKIISENVPVSVIIAIRNGALSLPDLINDLLSQEYKGEVEFILVDDHSQDNSLEIIKNASQLDSRFIIERASNGNPLLNHKKRALDAGISKAKNEWLLFTDVDCRLSSKWINGMSKYFSDNYDYVIGFSHMKKTNKLLNIFQSIDYLLLLIAARGAVRLNHPWACTGQNQAYRKSLYHKIDGFNKIKQYLQGDDSLFMNICVKFFSVRVVFSDDILSQVITSEETTWLSLFKQRIRWAGDLNAMWKINFIFFMIMILFFVIHLSIIIIVPILLLLEKKIDIFYYILFCKFLFELIFYYIGAMKLKKSFNLINFIIWFFIHIPYVVIIGLASFFYQDISWHGRTKVVKN